MIVIDANAALAISLGTEMGNALSSLLIDEEQIIAPAIIKAEISHALTKYVRGRYLELADAIACGRDALLLVDEFVDDESLWIEAVTESIRLEHSLYDMFYLLLARREYATLFTLDKNLQKLCAKLNVNCTELVDL